MDPLTNDQGQSRSLIHTRRSHMASGIDDDVRGEGVCFSAECV